MEQLLLNGKWNIEAPEAGFAIVGDIPGSDFGNLIKQGVIKNPLISGVEQEALDTAKYDFTFSREFEVKESLLKFENIFLRCACVDTLASIFVNDVKVAETNNASLILLSNSENLSGLLSSALGNLNP